MTDRTHELNSIQRTEDETVFTMDTSRFKFQQEYVLQGFPGTETQEETNMHYRDLKQQVKDLNNPPTYSSTTKIMPYLWLNSKNLATSSL